MKKAAVLLSVIILFSLLISPASGQPGPKIEMYFFYAEECPECQRVMKNVLPPLESKYYLQMKRFEINDMKNYEKLIALEERYKDEENKIPVVVIGDYLLSGEKEVEARLEQVIKEYEKKGGVAFVPFEEQMVSAKEPSGNHVYLAYFYKKGCRECDRVFYDLGILKKKYPGLIVKEFDIKDEDTKLLYEALGEHYGIEGRKRLATPGIIVGDDILLLDDLKRKNLEEAIEKYLDKGSKKPWEIPQTLKKEAKNRIITRFESFGVYGIALAGLIDGINPCAMATLAFFISYLTFIGRRSREVLMVGLSYSFANFLAYLLIGLGLLKFLEAMTVIPLVVNILMIAMALFVIALGFLSLYDYYLFKRGRTKEITLQLPAKFKKKIHETIRERAKASHIIIASFTIGFLIAFQELFCTGQVYLPTILFVSKISTYRISAIGYLVLYNLFFIIPLIVIFVLVYFGVRSESLSKWAEGRVGMAKILTALLFFAMGGILIAFMLYQV